MPFPEPVKLSVRKRAHHQCCLCKAVGVEVHHIIPHNEGGPDTEDNAAPLCPSCHEVYGANPTKRKMIRETRDTWYEICAARYAGDADRLESIAAGVEQLIDFQDFLMERLSQSNGGLSLYRSEKQILEALEELFDKIWYNRHLNLLYRTERGEETISPGVLKIALEAGQRKRDEYGEENLGP